MAEPLAGLRAIEFGQLLAGPFTGTLLGDFGADVIKVEPPGAGDAMRDWGRLRHNDHSLWWSILARNKRCVALNLREPEGQRIAAELAATRRHRARELPARHDGEVGLGPRTCTPATRSCIYARVSGYGQTGRYADRPGFASAGEAISGLRHINGYPDQAPPRSGISLGDTLAAQSAFQGILLALYRPRAAAPRARSSTRASSTPASRCSSPRRSSTRRPGSCASRPARGCRGSRPATSTAPRTASGS